MDDLFQQALALPQDKRAALAHQLLLSLDHHVDADYDADWTAEIERRLARVESGDYAAKDWREAMAESRERLRSRKS